MSEFNSMSGFDKGSHSFGDTAPLTSSTTTQPPSAGSNRDSLNLDDFEKVEADQLLGGPTSAVSSGGIGNVAESTQAAAVGLVDDIMAQVTNSGQDLFSNFTSTGLPSASEKKVESAPISDPFNIEDLGKDLSAPPAPSSNTFTTELISSTADNTGGSGLDIGFTGILATESFTADLLASAPPPPSTSLFDDLSPKPEEKAATSDFDDFLAKSDKDFMKEFSIPDIKETEKDVSQPLFDAFSAISSQPPLSTAVPDPTPVEPVKRDPSPEYKNPTPPRTPTAPVQDLSSPKQPTPPRTPTPPPREPTPPLLKEPTPPLGLTKQPTPPRTPTPPPREPTPPPREPTPAKVPTPTPREPTPPPREPTPPPREPTPPPREPTPTPRKPTPPPREPTPPPREPTPPPRKPTPPPRKPTPPPREPTPPPKEPTPPPKEPTPPPKEPTPPPKEPTPPPKEPTPPPKEPTPPPKEPTPPPKEPTPPPKEPTPPPKEPTPPPKEPTPPPKATPAAPRTPTPPPILVKEVPSAPLQEATISPGRSYTVSTSTKNAFNVFKPLVDLIYWRDVKKTGIVFGSLMVILLSLAYLSLISVVAYTSLAVLTGTITFRVYKNIMQAVQKSQDGHPFKCILEMDTDLPSDKVHEATDVIVSQINSTISELKRLFLVEDLVDSVKFGCLLWCLTYLGSWFNGLTLVILAVVALFSLPKVYEQNQTQIDQYVGLVRSQVNDVMSKVKAALPIGNKEKTQ